MSDDTRKRAISMIGISSISAAQIYQAIRDDILDEVRQMGWGPYTMVPEHLYNMVCKKLAECEAERNSIRTELAKANVDIGRLAEELDEVPEDYTYAIQRARAEVARLTTEIDAARAQLRKHHGESDGYCQECRVDVAVGCAHDCAWRAAMGEEP